MSPVMPPKPHYFEDKTIDDLFAEIEELISSSRELARRFDDGVQAPAVQLRKNLVQVSSLAHSLRKEIVARRNKMRTTRGK